MENILTLNMKYGVAGICVLLTLQILVSVGKFLWDLKEKKETASDEAIRANTAATEHLTQRLGSIETAVSDYPKTKLDIRRSFLALKMLSGDKWPDVRKAIMDEANLE